MMYAKVIDGKLREPRFPLRGERDVFTTDAEVLREYGYKPVRYTDTPELADDEYVTPIYTETETEIVVMWEVHENEPDINSDYIEAAKILLGEEVIE